MSINFHSPDIVTAVEIRTAGVRVRNCFLAFCSRHYITDDLFDLSNSGLVM